MAAMNTSRPSSGHPLTADERERLLHNKEHMTIRPTNAALLKPMLATIASIAEKLLTRTWTLVIFPEPYLFTGEHPVVHITPYADSMGYGVATAERLYMPVSTTAALVLSHPWAEWPEAVVHGTEELARRLNWAMLPTLQPRAAAPPGRRAASAAVAGRTCQGHPLAVEA